LPRVDDVAAAGADHEGLAAPLGHQLRPRGLWLSRLREVGELADLVDLSPARMFAYLAPPCEEPVDQLPARVGGQNWDAVVEDRGLVPLEWDATEPCD